MHIVFRYKVTDSWRQFVLFHVLAQGWQGSVSHLVTAKVSDGACHWVNATKVVGAIREEGLFRDLKQIRAQQEPQFRESLHLSCSGPGYISLFPRNNEAIQTAPCEFLMKDLCPRNVCHCNKVFAPFLAFLSCLTSFVWEVFSSAHHCVLPPSAPCRKFCLQNAFTANKSPLVRRGRFPRRGLSPTYPFGMIKLLKFGSTKQIWPY